MRRGSSPENGVPFQRVYGAHRTGLKISVVMPARLLPNVIAEHPEWEDRHYDLSTDSVSRSGKLDLFHPEGFDHLTKLTKMLFRT